MPKKLTTSPGDSPVTVHPFVRVRRAGVPLSFFETADPAMLIQGALRSLNGASNGIAVLSYDLSAGAAGVNAIGKEWCRDNQETVQACAMGPAAFFQALANKPPVTAARDKDGELIAGADPVGAIVFAHNCQRFIDDAPIMQAFSNCRDAFKSSGVTCAMLGPVAKIPPELKNDIPIFAESVPTEADILRVVSSVCEDQKIDQTSLDIPKIVDGLLGYLSEFGIEQAFCLSLRSKARGGGVDLEELWRLKVAGLKSLGLEISLPTAGFDTVGGNEGAKRLARLHLAGRERPRAVLWVDEIEKASAGAQAGNLDGGASMAIQEQFLFWTQSRRVKGWLYVGVPGAGKSLLAQVIAAEAKCPLIRLSFSGVKGGIVGASEANIRYALQSVDAIAQGRVLLISTCNGVESLAPELMARHTLGTVFFDYPNAEESAAIWNYYLKKYEIQEKPLQRSNWVGREIEACVEKAWLWNISLAEAAECITPVSVSNAAKMDSLRRSASGRFLSAAHPGMFTIETVQSGTVPGRKLSL